MSDLIRREDALMEARPEYLDPSQQGHESYNQGWNDAISGYYTGIKMLPPHDTVVDCSGFVKWILDEIMDEENWELNAVADGEIIARKLKKLGLLEVKDGYYVRTPSAEAVLLDIEKWRTWSHTYDNMCKGGEMNESDMQI